MTANLEISVLMPVFNAERYLHEAIASILTQTYNNFEFLIINDGSTDSSRDIIKSYSDSRIRLIDNKTNKGIIFTLNRGMSLAKNEIIARQDADDISHIERLEQQVKFLNEYPDVVLVGSQGRVIDKAGKVIDKLILPQRHDSIRWYQCFDNSFIHSSVMFRKEIIWSEYKGYGKLKNCEDWELWSRVVLKHEVANLPAQLVDHRSHSYSIIGSLEKKKLMEEDEASRQTIMSLNMKTLLGDSSILEQEIRLFSELRLGVKLDTYDLFIDTFDKFFDRYCQLFSGVRNSKDFKRTIALQYARIAYSLLKRRHRTHALKAYFAGICNFPAIFFLLPWPRIIALLLFGRFAQRIYLLCDLKKYF